MFSGIAQTQFFRCDKLLQGVPVYDIARQHTGFGNADIRKLYDGWLAAKKTWNVWEVPFDLTHGFHDEALAIGKRAQDIDPFIYFDSLEGTGHLDEAETCALKIAESYNDTSPEIELYAGHQDRFPA